MAGRTVSSRGLRVAVALSGVAVLCGSTTAHAGGLFNELFGVPSRDEVMQDPSANVPALEEVLRAAGWEPTPELSGAFHVGDIFDGQHRWQAGSCFSAEARTSTYTETEMISRFQAGVRTGGIAKAVAGFGASAGIAKQVKFGTPSHIALPGMGMQLSEKCRWSLDSLAEQGRDLSGWYVVKEILSAEITEQTCGRVDAQGRFLPLGEADAELAMSCSRTSLEPVAAAYRVIPIHELLDSVPPPPPEPAVTEMAEATDAPGTTEPVAEAVHVAAEPTATLWFLSDDDLYRLAPGETQAERIVSSSEIDISSSSGVGGAAFADGGNSLYTWGPRGLAWVNLATRRAERLSASSMVVPNAIPVDAEHLVFVGRRSYDPLFAFAWSSQLGKSVPLQSIDDPVLRVWGNEQSGAVVLGQLGKLRLLRSSDLREALQTGTPPAGVVIDHLPGLSASAIALAVPPGGGTAIVASSEAHPEFEGLAVGPVRFYELDLETGRTRKVGVDRDDNRGIVYDGYWDEHVGPVFLLSSCSECDDPGTLYSFRNGELNPYVSVMPWPTTKSPPELQVRLVQGQPELFVGAGGGARQVTDIRSERPTRLGGYGDECEQRPALAWRPWPSGAHVLVAAIHGICSDDIGNTGSVVETFLVDLEADSVQQTKVDVDLGAGWPYVQQGDTWVLAPADPLSNAETRIAWQRLGEWSPDGTRLFTASGAVISADGEITALGKTPDWWVWR